MTLLVSLWGLTCHAQELETYLKKVKPVLQERCFACHGALKQEGGLRLDTADLARRGGDSGGALVPGDPQASLLLKRIQADEGERMPPEGEPLKHEEIVAIRDWIRMGAAGPDAEAPETDPREHWAFRTPLRPEIPTDVPDLWRRNPIDAFIASRHRTRQLAPQPRADKRTWLRRVSLDLIGLPPTPEETARFLADESDEAYDRVVTRLLDSPQYGARWGRHWMDIWRYSDWWGLGAEVRNSQKHLWHWRDWIIESLNQDRGYDQMLREMLAADELYPNDLDKLRAGGFLARQYFKFNRTSWLDETIEHTAKSMLGLTFNCAKCHDHKYDPLSQENYYQFRALFEPYQIRTDALPGVLDFEKDGLPRPFDCNLDAVTHVHIRGDDRNPDTSHPLAPAVPAFLALGRFEPVPVELPPEASHPGLRPHVVEIYRKTAADKVAAAVQTLKSARARLAAAVEAEAIAAPLSDAPADALSVVGWTLYSDSFAAPGLETWRVQAGQWKHDGGRLVQTQTGAQRSALRLSRTVPDDFEVRLRYRPIGGQMWKSVGISFDVSESHDVLAYASSVEGGSKIQVAHKQGNDYVYPPGAAQSRPIPLNQDHELVLRVRGRIVNFAVDGQLALACELPVPRRPGALELIAFDAIVEFHTFELRTLPESLVLAEPTGSRSTPTRPDRQAAQFDVAIAEHGLEVARAEEIAVEARIEADRIRFGNEGPPDRKGEICTRAVRAERAVTVAQRRLDLVRAEGEQRRAAAEQQGAADKKVVEARQALEKALVQQSQPEGEPTPLAGALKTLESNLESEESRRRPFPKTSTGRRSALAHWITDPRHPLTARVAVNHIWSRHTGRPLVPTVFDFGRKGTPPTHPELLDWLAIEFREHGWSMKWLHRLIVTSETYRLASTTTGAEAALAADPENHFYWRANTRRMESQIVRDSLLFLSGELDLTLGGPSIPIGSDSRRRSLFFVHSHNEHHKFLQMFDDASVQECYRRVESIVPQQALALANSDLSLIAAEKIAVRLRMSSTTASEDAFVQTAFETVLGVVPTPDEIRLVRDALALWREAAQRAGRPDPDAFARQVAILALLNHNDFVTIR